MARLYTRRIFGSRHKPKTIPTAGSQSHELEGLMNLNHTGITSTCSKYSSLKYTYEMCQKHNWELGKHASQNALRWLCLKMTTDLCFIYPMIDFRMRHEVRVNELKFNSIWCMFSHELPQSRVAPLSPSPRSTCKSACTAAKFTQTGKYANKT